MRSIGLFSILLVACAVLGAQTTQQQATTKRTVTGIVVNSMSGEPIARALVDLAGGGGQHSTFTGPDGRFALPGIPDGTVGASAQKPGFFNLQTLGIQDQMPTYSVSADMGDVRISLMPAGRIEGHVVNTEGEPVEGILIDVSADVVVNGRRKRQPRGGANTDDTGYFRVDNLQPDKYWIHTAARPVYPMSYNLLSSNQLPPDAYAPAYYPGAADLHSSQPIEIRPGQNTQIELTLRAERTFRVSGVVGGLPSDGLSVSAEDLSGNDTSADVFYDQRSRRFALALPAGAWTLQFRSGDGQGNTYYSQPKVTLSGANVEGMQVVLQPAVSIPLQVDHSDSAPNNPVQVQLQLESANQKMSDNAYAAMDPGNGDAQASVFRGVLPGSYRVSAQSLGTGCIGSVMSGGTDLTREDLVITEGAQAQPIRVTLRNDCAAVTAIIRTPNNESSRSVILLVSDSGRTEPKIAMGGGAPGMNLGIAGITPGDYRVYAFSSIAGLEYANSDAMKDFPSQHVSLDSNAKASVNLDVILRGSR